jgi:glycine/D-amino acid oxidase-like deaminating enzyme
MTGFLTEKPLEYMANYYYEPGKVRGSDPFSSDPYMYVTRRIFDTEHQNTRLISIGGPEIQLQDREIYHRDFDVAHTFHEDSISFAEKNFDMDGVDEKFFWHGLMGYTKSGVRMVGREPQEPRLLYNLGCNGVGILPSIMGARKIAKHINSEHVEETIFDPKR